MYVIISRGIFFNYVFLKVNPKFLCEQIEDDKRYLEELEKFIKERETEFKNKMEEKTGDTPQKQNEDTSHKENKD